MKSIFKVTVFFFLCIFIGNGCIENSLKVGFLIHDFDKERWENDKNFFVEKVQQLGGTALVYDADNNSDEQIKQASQMINAGVKVLVVVPVDQFAAAEIVKTAHENNVKVISYDRLILNCPLDYYVSTDNVKIGELQAEYLTKIKPVGNYALIGGARNDHNSQFLYLGQMNILQPLIEKGDIKIVYNELTENWAEEEGYEQTKLLIEKTNSSIDAILAGNDAIARGALKALQEFSLEGKVLVAGMDADLDNLREIVKGTQTCTVYKPIEKMASTTAEVAMKFAEGMDIENTFQTVSNGEILVPSVLHDAMVVDKVNLRLTVVSEGYQSEENIYN